MGSYTTPLRSVMSVNVVCVSVVCVSVGPGDGQRTKVKSRRYDEALHCSTTVDNLDRGGEQNKELF